MWCGKLTDIVVINAPWKTCGHRVHCGKLTTSWWLMYCGKLAVTVCTFNKHLTLCVLWNTCGHRVFRQQTFDILCGVENLRSPCVLSTNIWHCVYCGKLAVTVCIVNRHLTFCGVENLRSQCVPLFTFCVLWKTCGYRVYRQHTFDIVCTVQNLCSPCVSSTNIWHCVYCGKLAVTVCIVNRHLTFCVVSKTCGHRVYRY